MKKLVILIQFKTYPSRDYLFFEESVLRRGSVIYQFKGISSSLAAAVIIYADTFAELDSQSLSNFNNQSTLIHIQLNFNPRATNCHIICLSWDNPLCNVMSKETGSTTG